MSTREEIIKYLLSTQREKDNISVSIYRNSFEKSPVAHIGEKEFINQLSLLESDGFIEVHYLSRRDLRVGITIQLKPTILHYEENVLKERKSKNKETRKEIRAWITLIIAIAGFVLSVISLYLDTLPTK